MSLQKSNPNIFFTIAGDPKQIPPVLEINDNELENFDFQDENIYKMMAIESFNPQVQNIRSIDSILNLTIQYRSLPEIGQLYSELSYDGLLKHDRHSNGKNTKLVPTQFRDLFNSNVTFINIPLNRDNSIYKIQKLYFSSYHTYCALLVSEIIKYFDKENIDKKWTIGLISPYNAQAILLNKLITSYGISENIKVYSDTVHGFQGDECDIIFFICNPNNYSYSGHKNALLSKEYIYNVAISRARDYLFVLHPFSMISNPFINKIGTTYKNNFGNKRIIDSFEIEKLLFNEENFIEKNSYISGHDNVNVFGISEMKFFIKANENAIDIQLRHLSVLK
jgi:superfamily I DNA and/or RNA helicase